MAAAGEIRHSPTQGEYGYTLKTALVVGTVGIYLGLVEFLWGITVVCLLSSLLGSIELLVPTFSSDLE